jgi:hypothetical protein
MVNKQRLTFFVTGGVGGDVFCRFVVLSNDLVSSSGSEQLEMRPVLS